MRLRSSWLQHTLLEPQLNRTVRILYFIGSPQLNDEASQQYIAYENEMYRDITQYSFIDSYQNNTYKAMSYMQ